MTTTANPHILLVEDDSLLRQAFRLLLEDAGYQIREAGTASEAIAKAKTETPDLILLDLGLPDAPGLDVARELRRQDATRLTPIIALTGRVGSNLVAECEEAGCTTYLSTPIEPKALMKRLADFLR